MTGNFLSSEIFGRCPHSRPSRRFVWVIGNYRKPTVEPHYRNKCWTVIVWSIWNGINHAGSDR